LVNTEAMKSGVIRLACSSWQIAIRAKHCQPRKTQSGL